MSPSLLRLTSSLLTLATISFLWYFISPLVPNYADKTNSSGIYYQWSLLRDNLKACHLYIGAEEILLRPLIPPTNTHPAFADAKQRIYMSATLGEGGDLERLTGRKKIERLMIPSGWDKQGIGRRFFMFPSLNEKDLLQLNLNLIQEAKRALFLVTGDKNAEIISTAIKNKLGFDTFSARDIELSKSPFISSSEAVAVISNRYDGIDFPDDECRLLIIQGLPRATNLQERFIVSRIGAIVLLNDRILTRVIQAVGRCTRSPNDYSAIVVSGDELLSYLVDKGRRKFLHPELQSELDFGIDQSKDAKEAEFIENFKLFIEHSDDWLDAEKDIINNRSSMTQEALPGMQDLRNAVAHEIDYQYCLWNSDFLGALDHCRNVLAALTDPSLRGYRALWQYLAGSAAYLGHKAGTKSLDISARTYFSQASKSAIGLPWLNRLSNYFQTSDYQGLNDLKASIVVERMEAILESLGTFHNGKFEEKIKLILDGLLSEEPTKFEQGHVELGQLLGYDAGNRETNGAPDPWWMVDDTFCFIFEDHSGSEPESSLDVTKARQAYSHPNWVKANLGTKPEAEIISVLITHVKKADNDAIPHLESVLYWNIEEFISWAHDSLSTIRELRKTFVESGDIEWRARAMEEYDTHKISPKSLYEHLKSNPASKALRKS